MTAEERNDLFYVCALIEFIARETKNRRGVVVNAIGLRGLEKLLRDAGVDHCLTFEQVSDEVIEHFKIPMGDFDTITNCKYSIPSFTDIGRLYSYLVEELADPETIVDKMLEIFNSFISDEISNFKTGVYCENTSYLLASHQAGVLLK